MCLHTVSTNTRPVYLLKGSSGELGRHLRVRRTVPAPALVCERSTQRCRMRVRRSRIDGYRQTLLGRTLADALRDLEEERDALEVDGDLLFSLFDEAMQA
ncbi:hypothetical protein PF001_g21097 [Phytophthora fragariae]|uniref:Uncharacterized protein n=1 Tax=Phytophthora fragariae TaxID=53985 RepID=A0A6A3SA27_9STRA|nr:hypothetical protein PF006_g20895 [Phytophthora fragariae]KAE9287189.1 hypothetical protein PF001_g21097 [Phytophthora fragariae]